MESEYLFIGRQRHWGRILLWGLLTFGIYGRVLVYKQMNEIDGHRALFINMRVVGLLLLLPIIAPLFVKLRLRRLLGQTVDADPTHPPVLYRTMSILAFVPVIPAFHIVAQRHLNIYWKRQLRMEEIKHRRSEIESLQAGRKSPEATARIRELQSQVRRRQASLDDEEEAARAIRLAEIEREQAQAQMAATGQRPRRGLSRISKGVMTAIPRRRKGAASTEAPVPASRTAKRVAGKPDKGGLLRRFRRGAKKPPK